MWPSKTIITDILSRYNNYLPPTYRSVVRASVILLPLLGLTWVFGVFAINKNTEVFAWLFTIFNSLQVETAMRSIKLTLLLAANVSYKSIIFFAGNLFLLLSCSQSKQGMN